MQWFAKISLGSLLTIYHLVPRDSHFLLSLIKGCACFGLMPGATAIEKLNQRYFV